MHEHYSSNSWQYTEGIKLLKDYLNENLSIYIEMSSSPGHKLYVLPKTITFCLLYDDSWASKH